MIDSLLTDPGADGVGVVFVPHVGRVELDGADGVAHILDDLAACWGLGAIARVAQVHSPTVHVLTAKNLAAHTGPTAPEGDALVTTLRTRRPTALLIKVADCVPVVLADAAAGVIGAAHAGRVGFVDGVLPHTVEAMRTLGARDITAWIGPHICGDCYEVPAAMRDEIAADHPAAAATTSWGTPALALGDGAQAQFEALGCTVRRVDPCTRTTPGLHSHRRDGAAAGRNGALVWLS